MVTVLAMLAALVTPILGAGPAQAAEPAPTIVVGAQAPDLEQLAGREVQRYLYQLTGSAPRLQTTADSLPAANEPLILLGTPSSNPFIKEMAAGGALPADGPGPEGYAVKTATYQGHPTLAVRGDDEHGVLYGGYELLKSYGARFYLDRDVVPETKSPFTVKQLDLSRTPAEKVRGLLPWHDFLNGPSAYSLEDFQRYIDQMLKMGMNTLVLHNYDGAYPGGNVNEPFMDFTCKGMHPEAWLDTSVNNQRWGMAPFKTGDLAFDSGDYFPHDIMGSDAARFTAKQPDEQKNVFAKAKAMMQQVIHYGQERGLEIVLGTDLDMVPKPMADAGCDPIDPAVLKARLDDILQTYPTLKYIQMYYSELNRISTEDAIKAYQVMHDHLAAKRPDARLVTGSWFQEERFPQMDTALPKDMVFSSLMPHDMTVKSEWAQASNAREAWAVPWMEFDGGLSEPQFAVSRMAEQLPKLRAAGVQGMIGILWRSRAAEANVAYLAEAAWQKPGENLSADDFYRDYAAHILGPQAAASGAEAFKAVERDGSYTGLGTSQQSTSEFSPWSYCGCPQASIYAERYGKLQEKFRSLESQVTTASGRDSLDFYTQWMRFTSNLWKAHLAVPDAAAKALPGSNYFEIDSGESGADGLGPDQGYYANPDSKSFAGAYDSAKYGPIQNDYGYPEAMKTIRYAAGPSGFGYKYPIKSEYSRYRVELYFAEIGWGVGTPADPVGKRVTDISINGNLVKDNFDIAKEAGGSLKGIRLVFDVPVTDQLLDIHLTPVAGGPLINALRAFPIDANGNALPKVDEPGHPEQAWEDLKKSGFREGIDAYQRTVREIPTLGGLVSAAGGRWYDGHPALYQDYARQIARELPVAPPDNVSVRGTAGGAALTWRPFDGKGEGVAGYNVYRAPAGSSEFTKLTSQPITAKSYADSASGSFAYAVTAVKADGTESPRSYEETVRAGSADDQAPTVLLLSEPDQVPAHEPVKITATVLDGRRAADLTATLHYRRIGSDQPWKTAPMATNVVGRDHTFYADIPASAVDGTSLEYYVSASDGKNTGYGPAGAQTLTNTVSVWPEDGGRPGAVTQVTVDSGDSGALVSWKAGGDSVQRYLVYRSTSRTFAPGSTSYLTYVPSQQTSFRDVTVQAGKRYYYRVVAETIDGRTGPASPPA